MRAALHRSGRPLAGVISIAVVIALAGCPSSRKVVNPEPPVPTTGDADARSRFEASQARFRKDGGAPGSAAQVSVEFEKIAEAYPDDPIVPHALLYAGMAAVKAGEYDNAIEQLRKLEAEAKVDPALRRRGQLFTGIALTYQGKYDRALAPLRAGEPGLNKGDEHERIEWHAAMAMSMARGEMLPASLDHFDAWHKGGRSAEKAFVVAELTRLAGQLDGDALVAAYGNVSKKSGPAAAIFGDRLAAAYRAGGDEGRAASIDREIADARAALGFAKKNAVVSAEDGDANLVGAVLPLSGKRNRVGDYSMRGLALAASFGGRPGRAATGGWPRPFVLSSRDSHSEPEAAEKAVTVLADEGAIAVVGPVDRTAVARAQAVAGTRGLPLVTLTPRADASPSPYVFHAVHSAEARARALARYAIKQGVVDFAILGPKTGYGRAVGAAFRDEVKRRGGKVIVESWYPEKTTSFRDYVRKLRKPWRALFVPDVSRRLELVAPALAAGNFRARPYKKGAKRGRAIWLLSTAESVSDRFLLQAGRYSWGAMFAPGFYPDRKDGRIGPFVERYEDAFGRTPTALDAYSFDAAVAVRAAVEGGATTRKDVADELAKLSMRGLTGSVSFDSTRRRADDGVFFEVTRDGEDYALTAVRR